MNDLVFDYYLKRLIVAAVGLLVAAVLLGIVVALWRGLGGLVRAWREHRR
jgi:hypothetical protein